MSSPVKIKALYFDCQHFFPGRLQDIVFSGPMPSPFNDFRFRSIYQLKRRDSKIGNNEDGLLERPYECIRCGHVQEYAKDMLRHILKEHPSVGTMRLSVLYAAM